MCENKTHLTLLRSQKYDFQVSIFSYILSNMKNYKDH